MNDTSCHLCGGPIHRVEEKYLGSARVRRNGPWIHVGKTGWRHRAVFPVRIEPAKEKTRGATSTRCALCGFPIHRAEEGRYKTSRSTERTRWSHIGQRGLFRHKAVLPESKSVPGPTAPGFQPVREGIARGQPPYSQVRLIARPEPGRTNRGTDTRAERCWEEDR